MSLKILCTFASCITKVNVRKLELSCDIIVEHNHFMVQETDALFQLLDPETDPKVVILFLSHGLKRYTLGSGIFWHWIV